MYKHLSEENVSCSGYIHAIPRVMRYMMGMPPAAWTLSLAKPNPIKPRVFSIQVGGRQLCSRSCGLWSGDWPLSGQYTHRKEIIAWLLFSSFDIVCILIHGSCSNHTIDFLEYSGTNWEISLRSLWNTWVLVFVSHGILDTKTVLRIVNGILYF